MQIISMDRAAPCPGKVFHHSIIPIFQSSSLRVLISREHERRLEARVRVRNEVKTITKNQREQQT